MKNLDVEKFGCDECKIPDQDKISKDEFAHAVGCWEQWAVINTAQRLQEAAKEQQNKIVTPPGGIVTP